MAEGDLPKGGNVGNFLKQSTAGLPNWAWILVIGAGIAAAILVPKYLNRKSSTDTSTGLGLAIDPVSGLPYAVEGLVPTGGTVGGSSNGAAPPAPTTYPVTAQTRTGPGLTTIIVRNAPKNDAPELPHVPAGSPIQIIGPPMRDQNNVAWYPIAGGGWIFGYDLVFNTTAGTTSWP